MSKEQLTEAKEMLNRMKMERALGGNGFVHGKDIKSIQYLIEQSERVESSKSITDNAVEQIDVTQRLNKNLREQNKLYREAIEKALGGCRYTNPEVAYILEKALEGDPHD